MHDSSADSDPVIIPYKAINHQIVALYAIITGKLSAYYSCADVAAVTAQCTK